MTRWGNSVDHESFYNDFIDDSRNICPIGGQIYILIEVTIYSFFNLLTLFLCSSFPFLHTTTT
jgi:hypothetical protein